MLSINTMLTDKLDGVAKSLWPNDFAVYEKEMNRCCLAIALDVVQRLGLFTKTGDCESIETIRNKIELAPGGEHLLRQLLFILTEDGFLAEKKGHYSRVGDEMLSRRPPEMMVKLCSEYPEESVTLEWLARCYADMVPLLRGQVYAEEVLFPEGDLELVDRLYTSSRIYSYYSELAGSAVEAIINMYFKRPISALEVGAGTGNGTQKILFSTKDFERYSFTDISRSFVRRAKKRFVEFDFMDYNMLDIDKPASSQGFGRERYDAILAVNVLHASKDIIAALSNLLSLLEKNGVLIVAEIAPPPGSIYRFMELTFGLIPSYYGYTDTRIRPLSPLLESERWGRVLKAAGCSQAMAVPSKQESCRGGVYLGVK